MYCTGVVPGVHCIPGTTPVQYIIIFSTSKSAPFSSLYLSGHLKIIQEKVHWSRIQQADGPCHAHDMHNAWDF